MALMGDTAGTPGSTAEPLGPDRRFSPPSLTAPSLVPMWAPRAFHAMVKPSGATCNLDCEYCFFLLAR